MADKIAELARAWFKKAWAVHLAKLKETNRLQECQKCGTVTPQDLQEFTVNSLADFAALAVEREKAIAWVRKNCQVDTGDGIYGDASKYTAKEIERAIWARDAERG